MGDNPFTPETTEPIPNEHEPNFDDAVRVTAQRLAKNIDQAIRAGLGKLVAESIAHQLGGDVDLGMDWRQLVENAMAGGGAFERSKKNEPLESAIRAELRFRLASAAAANQLYPASGKPKEVQIG